MSMPKMTLQPASRKGLARCPVSGAS
uniref:Uncharacterized protein n=1 Tax=Arundo donax TaxID=35708 RepID=A0A0A9HEK7_ARUDO